MKTLVIFPTYNERENIADLVRQVTSQDEALHVVVIDDGSPDGTAVVVRDLQRENSRVALITRPSKQGLGTAYLEGFRFALEHGFEHVVTMDADFSHDPAVLPELVRASLEHDVVIGSRYIPGGGIEQWGRFRRGLSRTANRLARSVLGLAVRDCTSGYRCYRRHVLATLPLATIRSTGYAFLVELLDACVRAGARTTEVPITFSDRRAGRSKLSRVEIYRGMLMLLRLGVRRVLTKLLRCSRMTTVRAPR